MALYVEEKMLQFEYENDSASYDISKFFAEEGSEKFDTNSNKQMLLMLQSIANDLNIEDEYSIKRAETMLRFELPFFAVNRRLIKKWILENFIY
ncbi:MAG: hypothetical protein QM482_06720 [Sulfurospirillum sp.]